MNLKSLLGITLLLTSVNAFSDCPCDKVPEENGSRQQCLDAPSMAGRCGNENFTSPETTSETTSLLPNATKGTIGERCLANLENLEKNKFTLNQKKASATNPAQVASIDAEIKRIEGDENIGKCKALIKLSMYTGEDINNSNVDKPNVSIDKRITCIQKGGFTIDYAPCVGALNMYNMVLNAETALNLTHKVMNDMNAKKQTAKVGEAAAQGRVQEAAIDASIDTNKKIKEMNGQRAMAYSAAVAALSSKMSWPSSNPEKVMEACQTKLKNNPQPIPCRHEFMAKTLSTSKRDIFANDAAKSALVAAIAEFIQKGIAPEWP